MCPRRPTAGRRDHRRASRLVLGAELFLAGGPLSRGGEYFVDAFRCDHDGPVGVEHHNVAAPDLCAADDDRDVELADVVLRGAAGAHEPSPHGKAEPLQILEVTNGTVDEQRGDALAERLRHEQVSDERDGRGLVHRQHEHVARPSVGDGRVDHQVVARPAACRSRRAGDARPGYDLREWDVDEALLSHRLVQGGDPEVGELGEIRHNRATTCGISRWNASA